MEWDHVPTLNIRSVRWRAPEIQATHKHTEGNLEHKCGAHTSVESDAPRCKQDRRFARMLDQEKRLLHPCLPDYQQKKKGGCYPLYQ